MLYKESVRSQEPAEKVEVPDLSSIGTQRRTDYGEIGKIAEMSSTTDT